MTEYTPAERKRLVAEAERRHGLKPARKKIEASERAMPEELAPQDDGPMSLTHGLMPEDTGPRLDPRVVERCWTLYRCLAVRSESIMQAPFRLYTGQGDDRNIITSGPAYDLVSRPNPWWDWPSLLAITEWTLNTHRRGAFWILDNFVNGKPTEIWWADPERVKPVRGAKSDDPEDWYIKHFEVSDSGEKPRIVDRKRVVWFRVATPDNEFANSPVLGPAMGPALMALKALTSNMLMFEQGMTGAGVIYPSDNRTWSNKQVAQMQSALGSTLKGRAGWHRIAVLNRGDFTLERLDLTPKDAQFEELMRLTDRQITIATGVPRPVIEPTDSTFANASDARAILWSNTLIPRLTLLAGTIMRQLIDPWFGDVSSGEFDLSRIPELQENSRDVWEIKNEQLVATMDLADRVAAGYDRDAAIRAATFYVGVPEEVAQAVIPMQPNVSIEVARVSEAREIVGAVIAGSLPLESGVALLQRLIGPDEILPKELPAPPAAPALPASPTEDDSELDEDESDPLEIEVLDGDESLPPARSVINIRREPRRATSPEPDSRTFESRAHREAWEPRVRSLEGAAEAIEPMVRRVLGSHVKAAIAAVKGADLERLENAALSAVDDDLLRLVRGSLLTPLVPGWIEAAYEEAIEHLPTAGIRYADEVLASLSLSAELDSDQIEEELVELAGIFATSVSGTSADELARVIAQEIVASRNGERGAGSTRAKASTITSSLGAVGVGWDESRIPMAAWTSAHSSAMAIADFAVRMVAPQLKRRWITSLDGRVRRDHVDAHGQEVGMDEPFYVGDSSCTAPGGCTEPGQNARCRCVVEYTNGG